MLGSHQLPKLNEKGSKVNHHLEQECFKEGCFSEI